MGWSTRGQNVFFVSAYTSWTAWTTGIDRAYFWIMNSFLESRYLNWYDIISCMYRYETRMPCEDCEIYSILKSLILILLYLDKLLFPIRNVIKITKNRIRFKNMINVDIRTTNCPFLPKIQGFKTFVRT